MSKETYLRRRTMQTLDIANIDDEQIDLSLSDLVTAFHNQMGLGDSAVGKDSSLATHYAQLLMTGSMVYLRDPDDNRTYYVSAHEDALVAVFYAMGPWYDHYAAICTKEGVLPTLGVVTPAFNDIALIDRIFGFTPEQPLELVDGPLAVADQNRTARPWVWFTPGIVVPANGGTVSEAEVLAAAAVATKPVHVVTDHAPVVRSESPVAPSQQSQVAPSPSMRQGATAQQPAMETQMTQAFANAQHQQDHHTAA